jgi:hypothetical protein
MGGRAAHGLADDLAGALPALRSPQARPSPRAAITLPSPPDRPMLSACGGVGDGMRPGEAEALPCRCSGNDNAVGNHQRSGSMSDLVRPQQPSSAVIG